MKINLWKPFLFITALLVSLTVLASMSYTPQDFAAKSEQEALIPETLRHAAEMHGLTEVNQANVNANGYQRRIWTTLFLVGSLGLLFIALTTTTAGYSVYAVASTVRLSTLQIAEARKGYQEIMHRPEINHLPDGSSIIELPNRHAYLRDVTGQMTRIAETPANAALVEVIFAKVAAQVAMKQGEQRGRVEVLK